MKIKKLLFGLIEMNGTLYNILYTVLCVVILLLLLCGQVMFITFIFEPENSGYGHIFGVITNALIIYFVGSKLMSKNNYT
jgi:hypothetical protein